jgi:peptide/nickel transport system substrate-binding protein
MTLGILPARLWNDISDEQFPFSPLAIEPVGAGPFAFESLARDKGGLVTEYTLKANRHYVLGRPYLDEIHFVFFSQEDELLAALKAGDVESAYGIPSEEALTAPYARVFGVFWNPNTNQIFARTEVRKALSFALDRDRLVQDVLGGYATAIMGPVPPGSKVTEAPVLHFEDPVHAAAEELRGAGWTYDTTERAWKNEDAKLSFNTLALKTSNVPELKSVAGAIKEDWEKLGITVDIELYEPGDLNQNVIRPRKYDALLFGMVIGREVDLYAFWSSAERNDPGLNIALYANKTVDTLLEEARQTSDEQKRLVNLQKVEEIIAAEYPAAFTHAPDFVYVTRKDLKGVRLPQITLPSDRFASVSEWYLDIDYVWPFLLSNT